MIWLLIDSRGPGGAERHIATLAESLRRLDIGAEVVLFADYPDNLWLAQLKALDLNVRVLDGSLRSLALALREHRPRLLHTHGYKSGILGRSAARLLGIPVVSTFHSGEREPFPVGAYALVDEWMSFLGGRIAVSEEIRRRLPFPAVVAPSYIRCRPIDASRPLPRRVAFVGRLSQEKAPELFCDLARTSRAGLEWHMFGDGPMRGSLEREFGDVVHFHGMVADLTAAWEATGLLVLPSRSEGLPLTPLEAMASGIPVLASRVGGLPTIVEHGRTGWLFESGDLAGARAGLEAWRSLEGAQQAFVRRACSEHVIAHFSEETALPPVLEAYRRAGLAGATWTAGAAANRSTA